MSGTGLLYRIFLHDKLYIRNLMTFDQSLMESEGQTWLTSLIEILLSDFGDKLQNFVQ